LYNKRNIILSTNKQLNRYKTYSNYSHICIFTVYFWWRYMLSLSSSIFI